MATMSGAALGFPPPHQRAPIPGPCPDEDRIDPHAPDPIIRATRPRPVEPPSASHVDWSGTVIVEDSIVGSSGDLYALAGLDLETWTILGIDMYAFSRGEEPDWDIHVYAFNRQEHGVDSFEAREDLEATRGPIPVRDILLHDVSLTDVVKCMKMIHLQFLSGESPRLEVVELGDHPVLEE